MKNLKALKDEVLLQSCDRIVKAEKKLTKLAVEYFAEVDRRRLYLMTHSSLFDFLTQKYEYSAGSAQRRIDAARLYQEIPEVSILIESGSLNITQISKIQKASRQAKKLGRKIKTQDKILLIESITENASGKKQADLKTEILIAQHFELPIAKKSRKQTHADESVTREDHYTKEENEIIQKAWDLVSHSVPSHDFKDFVLYLAKRAIASKTQVKQMKLKTSGASVDVDPKVAATGAVDSSLTSIVEVNSKPTATAEANSAFTSNVVVKSSNRTPVRKAVSRPLRRSKFSEHQGCQFKFANGEKCGATRFPQSDHIRPVWAGGTNEPENLRVLCAAHNQERYRRGT